MGLRHTLPVQTNKMVFILAIDGVKLRMPTTIVNREILPVDN
jgi:hypothetical protein